jgi:hypothetical protein
MSDSPWMGVLSIAGFAVAALLLLFLLLKADRLRRALNQAFGIPLTVGLLLSGVAVSVLTLRGAIGVEVVAMAAVLGIGLIDLSNAMRPRWVGVLMLLDGVVLLGVTFWSLAVRIEPFENDLWGGIFTALIIAAPLWVIGGGLYRFFRPRADLPPLNDQTSTAETGTPA